MVQNDLVSRVENGESITWTKENFEIQAFLLDFNKWKGFGYANIFIFENIAILELVLSSPEFALKTPTNELKVFLEYLHAVAWSIRQYGTDQFTKVGTRGNFNYVPNRISKTFLEDFESASGEYAEDDAVNIPKNGFEVSLPVVILNSLMSLPDEYGNYRGVPKYILNTDLPILFEG